MKFIRYCQIAKDSIPRKKKHTLFRELRFASRLYFTNHHLPERVDSFFGASPTRQFLIAQPGFKANLFRQQVRSCFYVKSSSKDRWHFAKSHFTFLENTHTQNTIEKLYGDQAIAFSIPHADTELTFSLDYEHIITREGFLRLTMSFNGTELYKITFWFSYFNGEPSLCIGALQGGQNTLEENRLFTKTFFGVRPQNMALAALRLYAKVLNIKLLLTFPKEKMWRTTRIAELTEINEFWHEQGAVPIRNTPFLQIDTELARKDLNDVASKKRSMYRHRYAFLDHLDNYLMSEIKGNLLSPQLPVTDTASDEPRQITQAPSLLPAHKHFVELIKRLKHPRWAAMIALAAALSGLHFAQQ